MQNLQAVVLAAGKATRFKTGRSKLLEPICGQEMILYPIKALEALHIPTTVVVGHHKEEIMRSITNHSTLSITFVAQTEQLGTGHALLTSKPHWQALNILVLNGDMPLLSADIIQSLYQKHQQSNAAVSFIAAHYAEHSDSYGRVVHENGKVRIVEAKEFQHSPDDHPFINAGIYLFKRSFLEDYCHTLTQNNAQKEFYLVDLIAKASNLGLPVQTVVVPYDAIRGVNTLKELWAAETIKRSEIISHWMEHGVRFSFAQNVHVDIHVSIGAGTYIGSGVQLKKGTTIGSNCTIGDFSILESAIVADHAVVHPHSVITDSTLATRSQVGPFAHIRQQTVIGAHSLIGNFVEVKKSTIGSHTKAKHLTYLGDAQIGNSVNIGAGTITCNHNGTTKNSTVIHDGAYIGSINALVAPVTIGKGAFTAAGSVITHDVPTEALAIARSRQVIKEGYARTLRERHATPQEPKDKLQKNSFAPDQPDGLEG
jgi:bifunctional UDP-N-acetylglucosamine pyrophosphorylase/glucosamine-1-phosphate N-acetyltransferase